MKKFLDINFLEGRDAPTAASMFDRVNNLFERYNMQLTFIALDI